METIKEILMRRDGMSAKDAYICIENAVEELMEALDNGDYPYDICEEHFGLEPDYLMELISML